MCRPSFRRLSGFIIAHFGVFFNTKNKNAFRLSEKLPHFLPLPFYLLLPKNPECNLGKSEEVRGSK
jgi:hypothetical protein